MSEFGDLAGLGFSREDLGLAAIAEPPENDVEAQLMRLFTDNIGLDGLGATDSFFVLGGDSLRAASLLSDIDRDFGVALPSSTLLEASTPRSLSKRIMAARGESAEFTPAASEPLGESPLFFFTGDFLKTSYFSRTLADVMGGDQTVIPIPPHVDGAFRPIREMALDRLKNIRQTQPHGPYRLGGHCNGALIAFEAARSLQAEGERVDFVVMIDPVSVTASPSVRLLYRCLAWALGTASPERRQAVVTKTWRWLARHDHRRRTRSTNRSPIDRVRGKSLGEIAAAAGRRIKLRPERSATKEKKGKLLPHEGDVIEHAYHVALSHYVPDPLDVPVLYFAMGYSGTAWRNISPNTTLVDIFGRHDRLTPQGMAAFRQHILGQLGPRSKGSSQSVVHEGRIH